MNFKRIWNWKSTIIEKAYFVKEASLTGFVVVFTDLNQFPLWENIDERFRIKLRKTIREVLGS